ncbi:MULTISPECIES: hypothetical protein [Pseudomonas]|uniref:Uncharacterized protein n=1 Tax=Pseudomonas hunanensis TaxID=1247546 RepID=A0ACC6K5P3_9PSED|nr:MULTISPECIES: hypothetical protein [Pseudomonas]MBP2263211.1 hypothetical protein [Pseudomonas sp. BP8]MDR6713686.1 hypothetical protein [Pseudomonas hunanensis]HDS1736775.1 hypothetical protein [Pseudomonas putida]
MRKIVPDPPHSTLPPQSLEDTLVQASEYTLCALTVAHQSMLLLARSPGSIMLLSVMHELDSIRALVESALAQVQRRDQPGMHTLH